MLFGSANKLIVGVVSVCLFLKYNTIITEFEEKLTVAYLISWLNMVVLSSTVYINKYLPSIITLCRYFCVNYVTTVLTLLLELT